MKALISPNEPVSIGFRVAEVCDSEFEVAEPLFWIECPIEITAITHFYDPQTKNFLVIPEQPAQQPQIVYSQLGQAQPQTQGAQTL